MTVEQFDSALAAMKHCWHSTGWGIELVCCYCGRKVTPTRTTTEVPHGPHAPFKEFTTKEDTSYDDETCPLRNPFVTQAEVRMA